MGITNSEHTAYGSRHLRPLIPNQNEQNLGALNSTPRVSKRHQHESTGGRANRIAPKQKQGVQSSWRHHHVLARFVILSKELLQISIADTMDMQKDQTLRATVPGCQMSDEASCLMIKWLMQRLRDDVVGSREQNASKAWAPLRPQRISMRKGISDCPRAEVGKDG